MAGISRPFLVSLSPCEYGNLYCCGNKPPRARANFFTILVDAIFTISGERLFTKLFEAIPPTATFPCVYRACNPD